MLLWPELYRLQAHCLGQCRGFEALAGLGDATCIKTLSSRHHGTHIVSYRGHQRWRAEDDVIPAIASSNFPVKSYYFFDSQSVPSSVFDSCKLALGCYWSLLEGGSYVL